VHRHGRYVHRSPNRGDDEVRALSAAVELYTNRLLGDQRALGYLAERGFERDLLVRQRVGFAAGDELVPHLAWRDVPESAARRVGLLRADGREVLAGRIVFPEIRLGQPVWLIGRLLDPTSDAPRYLGLPGPKPLLGWDQANRDRHGVCLVEGPMDLLALRLWGVTGVALCGTWLNPESLALLRRWPHVYAALDADAAGREATNRLVQALGLRLRSVALPSGPKDPADLVPHSDGEALFTAALRESSITGWIVVATRV
jgi:DNA primase